MTPQKTKNNVCPYCGTQQPNDASATVCIACGYIFGTPIPDEERITPKPAPQPKPTPAPKQTPPPAPVPAPRNRLRDWLSDEKHTMQEIVDRLEHTPLEAIAKRDRVNVARILVTELHNHSAPLTELPLLYQKFVLTYHRVDFPSIPHRKSVGDGTYDFPSWKWLETYAEGLNPSLDRWLSDERSISEGRVPAGTDDKPGSGTAESDSDGGGSLIVALIFAGLATYFIWWIGIFAIFCVIGGFGKLSNGDDSEAAACVEKAWWIIGVIFFLKIIGWIWSLIVGFFQWLF